MDFRELSRMINELNHHEDGPTLIGIKQLARSMSQQIESENQHVPWTAADHSADSLQGLNIGDINARLQAMTRQVHQYPLMSLKVRQTILLDIFLSTNNKEDLAWNYDILMRPDQYFVRLQITPRESTHIDKWKERVWTSLCDAGLVAAFLCAREEPSD